MRFGSRGLRMGLRRVGHWGLRRGMGGRIGPVVRTVLRLRDTQDDFFLRGVLPGVSLSGEEGGFELSLVLCCS